VTVREPEGLRISGAPSGRHVSVRVSASSGSLVSFSSGERKNRCDGGALAAAKSPSMRTKYTFVPSEENRGLARCGVESDLLLVAAVARERYTSLERETSGRE